MKTNTTVVEKLAAFTHDCKFDHLTSEVVEETKRLLLDAIGCTIGGVSTQKGKIGIEIGRLMGDAKGDASIIGTKVRVSTFGAAFANSELMNALDFDPNLPPGHVTPYVVPPAIAVAEQQGASGQDLIVALALAHEVASRIGKGMDRIRDTKDGKLDPPKVLGYSCTIFGATAGAMKVKGLPADRIAHGLALAGFVAPVNPVMNWAVHIPSPTVKYTAGGVMTQSALAAAAMAELGHDGNMQMLDDPEYGYASLVGSRRWHLDRITDGLGQTWRFASEIEFKPWPVGRGFHGTLDALREVLDTNAIALNEIEEIKVFAEQVVMRPAWLNRNIRNMVDAQFSVAHGVSMAAHRVRPGKDWQNPKFVHSPSVLNLMDKVVVEAVADYANQLTKDPMRRPARVEVKARGQVFVGEKAYAKGIRTTDPSTYMSTGELVDKFRCNVEDILSNQSVDAIVDALLNIDRARKVADVMRMISAGLR